MKKTNWWFKYKTVGNARAMLKEGRKAINKAPEGTGEEALTRVRRTVDELDARLKEEKRDHSKLERLTARLAVQLNEAGLRKEKGIIRQYAESIGWAVAIALLIRFFLFEPFKIPTGSMIPTLQIGDHIFVSKSVYGIKLPLSSSYLVRWGTPERGDIVVFPFPIEGHPDYGKDFIKRVIGLPGDRIQLRSNVLHVNGEPIETAVLQGLHECGGGLTSRPCTRCVMQDEVLGEHQYVTQHCPPNAIQHPDWPRALPSSEPREFKVPEGSVFVMGDNRDNSADGRFWTKNQEDQFTPQYHPNPEVQTVPIRLLKGRAVVIWWAQDKSRLFSMIK